MKPLQRLGVFLSSTIIVVTMFPGPLMALDVKVLVSPEQKRQLAELERSLPNLELVAAKPEQALDLIGDCDAIIGLGYGGPRSRQIIQAGKKRMAIAHVPVATNENTRDSRLFDSVFTYIKKSAATIVRIYTMYEPLKVFTVTGGTVFLAGFVVSLRFLFLYLGGQGQGNVQSLILSAVLMIVGFQVILIGLLVADAIASNRRLTEELLFRIRSIELSTPAEKSPNLDTIEEPIEIGKP